MEKGHRNLKKTVRAKQLRQDSGVSERVIWEWLRNSRTGFKFRRQYPFEVYILDFYCAEAMQCVEIDGELHQLRREQDSFRDKTLVETGIVTLRIPSIELFDPVGFTTMKHLDSIVDVCESRTQRQGLRPWTYW